MKISYNWIKEILPELKADAYELAEVLTMIGLEIEAIQDLSKGLDQVVVAKIVSVEKHPQADKLKLCQVSDGKENFQIVCGASNAEEGKSYPLAKIGALLPNGLKIKPAKIRKVESFGMLCSSSELGLSLESDGILELNLENESQLGISFSEFYGLEDIIIEIGITPNRGDCLSMKGVARDIAAYYDLDFEKGYEIEKFSTSEKIQDQIKVVLEDNEQCYRYASRIISDVKICDSPSWLKRKLESLGLRSVNNVVDATNYVMMLTGHPVHAFDYRDIQGQSISIRKAGKDQKFKTLDGEERELVQEDLVICDEIKPIALAGIMGGENSEIKPDTQKIVLEVAAFNPVSIRRTSKRLGLSTDSSYRFERVISPEHVLDVLNLLTSVICKISQGKASEDIIDLGGTSEEENQKIVLRKSEIKKILGIQMDDNWVMNKLARLKLSPDDQGDFINCLVPSFRPDLTREIDLIEELIRLYGFDKVLPSLPAFHLRSSYQSQSLIQTTRVKDFLVNQGFQETIHLNFSSTQDEERIGNLKRAVRIKNPLSAESEFLRTSLFPNLVQCVQKNQKNSDKPLQFFELRTTHQKEDQGKLTLAGIISDGEFSHWTQKNFASDFYFVKGLIDRLFYHLKLKSCRGNIKCEVNFMHPHQSLSYEIDNKSVGFMGKIHPEFQNLYDLKREAYYFEFDFEKLVEYINYKPLKFNHYSQFPKIVRDLALVVDSRLDYRQIIDNIESSKVPYLSRVELFDVYEGEKLPEGKKSFSFSLVFEDLNRTLTDEEVNQSFLKLFKTLEKNCEASLRESKL